jgi:hypothetical protein
VEILLNLVWAALALLIVGLWLRVGSPAGSDRRRQIIAIAVLIAILFPVISVSDDLIAAVQSSSEQDTCQRRDYLASLNTHPLLPFAAIVSALIFDMNFGSPRFMIARSLPLPSVEHPELGVTGNRAPPVA